MKKLTTKCVYELTLEELQELDLQEWEEYALFEWDCDFMKDPEWQTTCFFIRSKRNIVIISDYSNYDKELLEFCKWQNTKVSLSGYNTRSETKKWKYMEENNWNSFEKSKKLKIAYRGGCGYYYTLFEYC